MKIQTILFIIFISSTFLNALNTTDTKLNEKEKSWLKQNKKVKIRVANVPPLHFMENGVPKGISVDFMKYIGTKYNINIEFIHNIPWKDALSKIEKKTGEVDLLLSIGYSKDRENFINFSSEYIELPNMIYTETNKPVTSLKDLKDKKVVIEKGFLVRKFIDKANLNIEIINAKNTLDALEQLSNGKADAYIGDILIANYFIEVEQLENIKMVAPTDFPLHTQFFGIRKDWPELASIINKGLLSMNNDEKQLIKGKWLGGKFEIVQYKHLNEVIVFFIIIILIILYFMKKIKVKEEESNFLLNSIPVNIFYKDKDLNYIKINQSYADILKIKPDDVLGKNDYDFWPKEFVDKYRDDDKNVLNSKERLELEESFEDNGEIHYVNTLKIPIIKDNKSIALLGIFWDVTKYKKALEEIKQKDEMLISQSRNAAMGEMISMIAHQWRQPLHVISMATNNMKADIELEAIEKDDFNMYCDDVQKQTIYLSQTITDFQNFFKPEQSKEIGINVADILNNTLDIIGQSLKNNNIKVITEFKEVPLIDTYAKELLQVFINILKNSKDALEERNKKNSTIKIELYEENKFIKVLISDNAGGIEVKNLDKIFKPYFSTKDVLNGTGLGLHISKTIIEMHLKGKIKVYNNDEGAVFEIVIPQ